MQLLPLLRNHHETILKTFQITFTLCAGFFVWYGITDSDLFWHLSAGREMITHKKFIFQDPFSFTLPNARWIDVHWLFQICMYLCWRIGGYFFLIFVKAFLVAVAVYLSISTFKRTTGTILMSGFLIALIYFQRYLIPLRPTLFTLLFIAVFIRQLEHFRKNGRIRQLIPILVTQILWVNSQGLFMLGIVITTAYGIGENANTFLNHRFPAGFIQKSPLERRQRSVLLALPVMLTALSLVNPYGWHALIFALKLFFRINPSETNIYAHTIIENMPLLSMIGTRFTFYVIVAFTLTSALIITSLYSSSIRIAHLLCAGGGLLLAVMAQRNGILYTFFAFPALLWNSSHFSLQIPVKLKKGIISVSAVILSSVLPVIMLQHARLLHVWPRALSPFSHPVHSAEILKTTPRKGNLFNADRYGGYLLWKTFPTYSVSHDTRLTLRPGSFYREYLTMVEHPERFPPWAEKWNIATVCLPIAPIDRYLPLAIALYNNPGWRLVFTDGAETLFLRSSPENPAAIDLSSEMIIRKITDSLQKQFSHSPVLFEEANRYLALFCLQAGAAGSASKVIKPFNSPSSRIMKAIILEHTGNVSEAQMQLEKLVAQKGTFIEGRLQLALFYLRHNKKEQGIVQLSKVLKKDPFHRRARNVLFNLTKKQKEQP